MRARAREWASGTILQPARHMITEKICQPARNMGRLQLGVALASVRTSTLETTQVRSPTDATRFWWHLYGS